MAKAKRNIEPKIEPVEKPVRKRAYNRKVKEPEQPIETIPEPIHEEQPQSKPYENFIYKYFYWMVAAVFLIALFFIYKRHHSAPQVIKRSQKVEVKASELLKENDSLKQIIEKEKFRDSVKYVIDSALESKAKQDRISYENYSTKERTNNKKKEDDVKKILRNPNVSWRSLDSLLDSFVPR